MSVIRIEPDGIYDDDMVYGALDVSAQTLARARREGRLRFSRQGRRVLYLGRWLLDWLKSDATPTDAQGATSV
jgi:hypothetical protein